MPQRVSFSTNAFDGVCEGVNTRAVLHALLCMLCDSLAPWNHCCTICLWNVPACIVVVSTHVMKATHVSRTHESGVGIFLLFQLLCRLQCKRCGIPQSAVAVFNASVYLCSAVSCGVCPCFHCMLCWQGHMMTAFASLPGLPYCTISHTRARMSHFPAECHHLQEHSDVCQGPNKWFQICTRTHKWACKLSGCASLPRHEVLRSVTSLNADMFVGSGLSSFA